MHIAPAGDGTHRGRIEEQEIERKDRKYGRYHSGSIWGPDRLTIFYIDTVPIGLALTEMTERVTMRYINGDYYRERLAERLALARAMMGRVDPLDFIENWQAPDERYRSKYDQPAMPPAQGTSDRQ